MKHRLASLVRGNLKLVAVAAAVALVSGSTAAIGARMIGSKNIRNGSVRLVDLNPHLRQKINKRRRGPRGPKGNKGDKGDQGDAGQDATYQGPHWGLITRNTIGSAVGDLRAGPFGSFGVVGDSAAPPFGDGSLGLQVSDEALSGGTPQEKVSFGNEVDFFGDLVTDITDVGFHVFQTGENAAISTTNMPNISLEVDPNLDGVGSSYSSLVFVPDAAPVTNEWSGYIDATSSGGWYLTNGASATATGCSLATPCSWAALQAALTADDGVDSTPMTIYTVAVGKGRDSAWVGAVDGLRINDTIYDFEPFGVRELPAS